MQKKTTRALVALTLAACAHRGLVGEPEPMLTGAIDVGELAASPYNQWFESGFDAYAADPATVEALQQAIGDSEVTVFFGTWCGDSQREVPRMARILSELSLKAQWIAVDHVDGAYKRSPGGEEKGLEIYRVPTFIVRQGGRELGRIVEFPVVSLEEDLLAVLRGSTYTANYRSYPQVRSWLDDGRLSDASVSAETLATELKQALRSEGELAAAAKVMVDRGQVREGLKLHRVNCLLHRESATCRLRLATALDATGDREGARGEAERARQLNRDPELAPEIMKLLEPR
ncbi:MAG: thioredoxin family protein [Myxococcota bacterium]